MNITIRGLLARDAECRTDTQGRAVLMLVLDNGHGWPIEVHRVMSNSPDDHDRARAAAREMRRGRGVWVSTEHLRARTDHATVAIVACGVERVQSGTTVL